MAYQDPFDNLLRKLGLYQHIQDLVPIQTADLPAETNRTLQITCQTTGPEVSDHIREQLALKFIKFIHPIRNDSPTRIRPISLIWDSDGTVKARRVRFPGDNQPSAYPARYRIPTRMIHDLPLHKQVWRSEKFALGTLLYELLVGHAIFDGLSNEEVQDRYSNATTFPDLAALPLLFQCLIYACWSAEFGRYMALSRFARYVQDNPARFTLQVLGGVISTAAIIAVPVLGAAGFSALGPVAGSAAAGWQASIGAVEAGSLFALCQSAAMGGAAATGLATTGVGGAALALAASGLPSASSLREIFIRKFRGGSDSDGSNPGVDPPHDRKMDDEGV